jgi:asparagine synthase (glutamine-hydrolysing)
MLRSTGFDGDFIEPTPAGFDREFERFVEAAENLVPGSVFYAGWLLSRRARELGLTVMLSGQGSDEIFGGYEPWDVHVAQLWNCGERWAAVREGFLSGRRRWGAVRGARHTLGVLRHPRRRPPCPCSPTGTLQQHQRHLLLLDYLPALLTFEDRDSMAWGIEVRLPYLDHRLVELARSLPDEFLARRGWTKAVLRRAIGGVVPETILRRPRKLGLPGPLEGKFHGDPNVAMDAWKRLSAAGWLDPERLPGPERLSENRFAFRVRLLDAWSRRCLGAAATA